MKPNLTPNPSVRAVRSTFLAVALAGSLAACTNMPAAQTAAAYEVDLARSAVTFVTTKAGAAGVGGVTETMRFARYSGGMDASGKVSLSIDLASIDSGIGIRDDRMRQMLWNVKATPMATFSAQLPSEVLRQVGSVGQPVEVAGQLEMAGQAKLLVAKLMVTPTAGGQLLVSTVQPVVVNANDFGLKNGVEALREAVGLNFISTSAPVSLNLALKAK